MRKAKTHQPSDEKRTLISVCILSANTKIGLHIKKAELYYSLQYKTLKPTIYGGDLNNKRLKFGNIQ